MQVPVRRLPQTRVSEQQQGYAKGGPGLDMSPVTRGMAALTEVAQGFRNQLQEEQRGRQRVEMNRRMMQEVNELQTDFEARKRDPEISPIDFADSTNQLYTQ